MKQLVQYFTACVVAVSLAGCIDDIPVGEGTSAGTYTLRTVNDAPLPYTLTGSGANKTELLDDAIALFEGFTFAETRHIRTTVNGTATTTTVNETGNWIVLGNSVTLRSNETNGQRISRITGKTLTIVENGVTQIFSK